MRFYIILNDPDIARHVCREDGVIPFVDLEYLGKADRQGHLDTWRSTQTAEDVTRVRTAVPDAEMLVRVNPLNPDSAREIDDVVARGADCVMLPMFRTADDMSRFLDLLKDRAIPVPLFETADAVRAIPQIIERCGIRRLHIGLNDLHLDLGMAFMFQPLSDGILEEPAAAMRETGVDFGIGGLARAQEGIVSPEFLLGEHVRLGSKAAILSRTFHRNPATVDALIAEMDFSAEIAKLRGIYAQFEACSALELEENRKAVVARIEDVARLVELKRTKP